MVFITVELLRKYNACEEGIRYIERFYPNGAEIIDIIRDKHIPKEILHWGRRHLTVSLEELAAYCVACEIEDSENYWYSVKVKNSQYVVKSKNVLDSRSVFESSDIVNCIDVVGTDDAENSSQIFYSSMVSDSQKTYKGTNITSSTNVCNSMLIARSENVIDSNTVFDSSEIIKSKMVSSSHFCQDCTNIDHCMFCEGLSDAKYFIFNQPVDPNNYELFEKQYKKYMINSK